MKLEGSTIQVSMPIPENPWDAIHLEDVERFEQAVKTYLRDIGFDGIMAEQGLSLLVRRSLS